MSQLNRVCSGIHGGGRRSKNKTERLEKVARKDFGDMRHETTGVKMVKIYNVLSSTANVL